MIARTVSVILIVALIACPLWCGNGQLHAAQCCSVQQSLNHDCTVHGTDADCCKDSCSGDGDRGPSRCPIQSSCQGVCGGAVIEKPVEVDNAADPFYLPRIDTDTQFVTHVLECSTTHRAEHHCHCRGSSNYGRSLRSLQMSFLL